MVKSRRPSGVPCRYTHAETTPPGSVITDEVAFATTGSIPTKMSAGKRRKVPPPAKAFTTPQAVAANNKMTHETVLRTPHPNAATMGIVDEKPFDDPRIALNRIYTKRGDSGETSLAGGQRVPKDSLRIEAYGAVDELNAFVGLACVTCQEVAPKAIRLAELFGILRRVQHELFNLGSILATLPKDVHPKQARITEAEVVQLEREIDAMNAELPALRSFVLPGGTRLNAELHAARTICRRAERLLVALARHEETPPETVCYLNRLSDALFVWSRWVNHQMGLAEVLWEPNQAASGRQNLG
jgi:cob(I)alamin adenosyltransferase